MVAHLNPSYHQHTHGPSYGERIRFDCDVSLDEFLHVEADSGNRVLLKLPCGKDSEQRCLPTVLEPDQSDLSVVKGAMTTMPTSISVRQKRDRNQSTKAYHHDAMAKKGPFVAAVSLVVDEPSLAAEDVR